MIKPGGQQHQRSRHLARSKPNNFRYEYPVLHALDYNHQTQQLVLLVPPTIVDQIACRFIPRTEYMLMCAAYPEMDIR